jgi:eukaryotic-like serine/threonine-protein kinase
MDGLPEKSLDTPSEPEPTADLKPAPDRPLPKEPAQIGPFRILERIGEGGMGIVYKAEQREPVRRIVALKVIKLGMDTKEVVARFEAERQALALMSHPNVAKVYEAGMTDAGRPFFAMEHVPGIALTQYCDEARLTTRERLELFIPVCHAVQHAHQKGIIHRDLKPSNILVQLFDGKPVPKVIDFGIAKATNQALTQRTLYTQTGSLVGTVEYMSPEQAMTSGLDVDTRTDIYSLGVVLYELLTGSLPFDVETLRKSGPEAAARIIRESEPRKPSTRLTGSKSGMTKNAAENETAEIAKRHRTDARTLRREIRGDLDWITLKAMEKERTRRYETANGLALEIQRHLNDEPVLARPPSATYRMSKFVRKHKGGVMAAGFVLLALLLGMIATGVALVMAKQSEAAAKLAEAKATDEATKALALSQFLEDLLGSAQPGAASGRTTRVVDLLDRASAEMSEKFRDQPEVEINARMTLGKTYHALAIYPSAERNYRRAYELAQKVLGKDAETTLDAAANLAFDMIRTGQGGAAKTLAEETLSAARRALGEHHRVSYTAANSLAAALGNLGSKEEALAVSRELVREARDHPGVAPPEVYARYLNNLAVALGSSATEAPRVLVEEETLLREVLKLAAGGVKVRPDVLALVKNNLGVTLREEGKYVESEAVLRDGLAYARSALGDSHPTTRSLVDGEADALERLQRFDEAIPFRKEQLNYALAEQPQNGLSVAYCQHRLAYALVQTGKFDEAFAHDDEAIGIQQKLSGIYDDESRQTWYGDAVLKFSVGEPWASQAVRAGAGETFFNLLVLHPTRPMPADNLIPDRLRFKLLRWQGEAAGKEKALSPVTEGSLGDLRKLADPAPGVYLLWLEVPRADRQPLHYADWIQFAPWQLSFYNLDKSPEESPTAWEQIVKGNPAKQASLNALAIDEFWHCNRDLPPRPIQFGTLTTATVDVPVGRYRFRARSSGKFRIWVDDHPLVSSWQSNADISGSNDNSDPIQLRVEHFDWYTSNYNLWFRLVPDGDVANAAKASLIDPLEPINQALAKFGADPQMPNVDRLAWRENIFYAAGKFKDAAEEGRALIELQPTEHWHWFARGCLLAYLDDTEAYRAHCRAMLERFGDTKDQLVADRLGKTCLLLPSAGGDVERLNELIDRALSPGPESRNLRWFQMAKGMAEYRAGHFEAAIDWLTRSRQAHDNLAALATIETFLAMANYRLGHESDARTQLGLATHRVETQLPKAGVDALPATGEMENWLIAHVALREAEALIGAATVEPAGGKP